MERFFDDSVIRGLATKAQQWGPSNVALQRGPDPKSIVMGVPMTGGPVTGVGGGQDFSAHPCQHAMLHSRNYDLSWNISPRRRRESHDWYRFLQETSYRWISLRWVFSGIETLPWRLFFKKDPRIDTGNYSCLRVNRTRLWILLACTRLNNPLCPSACP